MPSDDPARLQLALDAVARPKDAFRSAVIAAHERAMSLLGAGGGAERVSIELGAFGAQRIDPTRFAALGTPTLALDDASRRRMSAAADTLAAVAAGGDDAFLVDVPRGARLGDAVATTFARLGTAFGAARVVELIRSGRYEASAHDRLTEAFGYESWIRSERLLAPPLVVRVHGATAQCGELAQFLDGATRIVLIVEGQCAPAPLARLISPGVLVLQTTDSAGLDALARCDGPAIVGLVPPEAACFLHDPAAGHAMWQRMRVWKKPSVAPKRTIGGASAWQQKEDLSLLDTLSERPALESAPVSSLVPAGGGDPTDRLASWLLDAAGLAK